MSENQTDEPHGITHREIYERVLSLEVKVDALKADTTGLVKAFKAAEGAFTVLEWLAKLAKPILWLAGGVTAVVAIWDHFRIR